MEMLAKVDEEVDAPKPKVRVPIDEDQAQSPKKKPRPSMEGGGEGPRDWCHDSVNLATEHAKFRSSEDEITLAAEPRGWEQFLNKAAARQFNAGVHFYTRVVQLLRRNDKMKALDQLGHGDVAAEDGQQEHAHEWLCSVCVDLVARMGSGRSLKQLGLTNIARKAMAGGGHGPAKPHDLACLFFQLMAAGDRHLERIPFRKGCKPTCSSSGGDTDVAKDVTLPEGEIETLIDEHFKGAAHGVKRATVARAVRAQAAQAGPDFQGMQLTHFNNFTGKARGGGSKELEAGQH
jgi:hypothetical protein